MPRSRERPSSQPTASCATPPRRTPPWTSGTSCPPDVRKRIATAATALIIEETTVQELISAYAAFSATADFVIGHVPRRSRDSRILTSEDQDTYFDTPAYRRLVKLVARLSSDERIDLLALAWFGRESTKSSAWAYFLNHAYRMGIDDPHCESGLDRYWQAGLDRLRDELRDTT